MVFFHVQDLTSPACADPVHLPLVDEAFRRPGGEDGQRMRDTLCRHCPAAEQCAAEALARGEWGIWGGTTLNARTRAGGVKPTYGRRQVVA